MASDEGRQSTGVAQPRQRRAQITLSTAREAVYDALLGMVVRLELPPGERLIEVRLAEMLGVSKTPVREALTQLATDGLVDIEYYRGAQVRWISKREIEEQGFLLDTLENAAYELVVERITSEELDGVVATIDALAAARAAGDGEEFGRLTRVMHQQLFVTTRYPRLAEMIVSTVGPIGLRHDWLLVYPFADSWDELLALQQARVEAIRARNAEAARTSVAFHRRRLQALNATHYEDPAVKQYMKEAELDDGG